MNWDDHAATWDEQPATRAYADAAFASLQGLSGTYSLPLAGALVCDFGAGTGLLTERMRTRCARVDAVDASPAMLAVLRGKIEAQGWANVRPFAELPSDAGEYDLVVCSSVCSFLPDYPGAVRRLASRLKPGGLFVQWDWELDPREEQSMGLTREAIRACLRSAELDVLSVETAFTVTIDETPMSPVCGVGRRPPAPPSGFSA